MKKRLEDALLGKKAKQIIHYNFGTHFRHDMPYPKRFIKYLRASGTTTENLKYLSVHPSLNANTRK